MFLLEEAAGGGSNPVATYKTGGSNGKRSHSKNRIGTGTVYICR